MGARPSLFCYLAPVFSPPPAAEQLARDMAQEMPSPYCPGRSIASCPSEMARKLEDDILQQAAAGQSRQEIEQTLVARFGREKMGYAQSNAVFVTVTLLAVLAIVGIFVMGRRIQRARAMATAPQPKSASPVPATGPSPSPSQAQLDDLEDELDALDGL